MTAPVGRTLLLRNAALVATFDDARRELAGASVLVRGNRIEAIGRRGRAAARRGRGRGRAGAPRRPRAREHPPPHPQSLTRAVAGCRTPSSSPGSPASIRSGAHLTPEMSGLDAGRDGGALAVRLHDESDHLYVYPNGVDGSRTASRRRAPAGMRFTRRRGAMTVGRSAGRAAAGRASSSARTTSSRDMLRLVGSFHDRVARRHAAGRDRALLAVLGLARADAGAAELARR